MHERMEEREVADRSEIRELLARHARGLETKDFDSLDDVFARDATVDSTAVGGALHTWPETKIFLAELFGPVHLFRVYVGDATIELAADGSEARVETTNRVVFVPHAGDPATLVWGVYDDRFTRTPDGWRLLERVDRPMLRVEVPLAD